jgi:hypothetical protein
MYGDWHAAAAAVVLAAAAAAVWWAVSTFYMMGSEHGLGPYTLAEVIFTMVYIAVNILLWGFILGSITLLVQRSDEQSYKYRHRMHALERYGSDTELPQASDAAAQWGGRAAGASSADQLKQHSIGLGSPSYVTPC